MSTDIEATHTNKASPAKTQTSFKMRTLVCASVSAFALGSAITLGASYLIDVHSDRPREGFFLASGDEADIHLPSRPDMLVPADTFIIDQPVDEYLRNLTALGNEREDRGRSLGAITPLIIPAGNLLLGWALNLPVSNGRPWIDNPLDESGPGVKVVPTKGDVHETTVGTRVESTRFRFRTYDPPRDFIAGDDGVCEFKWHYSWNKDVIWEPYVETSKPTYFSFLDGLKVHVDTAKENGWRLGVSVTADSETFNACTRSRDYACEIAGVKLTVAGFCVRGYGFFQTETKRFSETHYIYATHSDYSQSRLTNLPSRHVNSYSGVYAFKFGDKYCDMSYHGQRISQYPRYVKCDATSMADYTTLFILSPVDGYDGYHRVQNGFTGDFCRTHPNGFFKCDLSAGAMPSDENYMFEILGTQSSATLKSVARRKTCAPYRNGYEWFGCFDRTTEPFGLVAF